MRLPTLFYAMLLILALCLPASSNVIYVRANCPGTTHDGNGWDIAFLKVQEGINAAAASDEVWVAAGTYVERITLKDSVGLYGGFIGKETRLSQRNWKTNVTTIDANGTGSVVTVPSGATAATIIDGFTIRNGTVCST